MQALSQEQNLTGTDDSKTPNEEYRHVPAKIILTLRDSLPKAIQRSQLSVDPPQMCSIVPVLFLPSWRFMRPTDGSSLSATLLIRDTANQGYFQLVSSFLSSSSRRGVLTSHSFSVLQALFATLPLPSGPTAYPATPSPLWTSTRLWICEPELPHRSTRPPGTRFFKLRCSQGLDSAPAATWREAGSYRSLWRTSMHLW